MDELKRLFRDVENKLKQNVPCDRNIFIVLHPRSSKKDLSECGHHLIEIINGVRKSAKVEKRKDYPNLILVQTIHEVPETSNNIVYWNSRVFGEKLAIRLEQIMRLLDSSTVHNPFVMRDGCLVNSYGPIRQRLDLDPCGHELNHDSFKDSLHEVIIRESKVFSIFQTFVHGIFYSQYCDHCLTLVLNFMQNANLVSKFVWNLSRGVWSPKTHKEMEQCFDWKQYDEKLYKPNCWRLLEDELNHKDDHFGPISSSSFSSEGCNYEWNNEEDDINVASHYADALKEQRSEALFTGRGDEPMAAESSPVQNTTETLTDETERHEEVIQEIEQKTQMVAKRKKPRASASKRRSRSSLHGSGPRSKKSRVAKPPKASIEEERTNMFINRIVDSGFRVSKRQENVLDHLPDDETTWTRDHHRMAALEYTFFKLHNFQPEFLENRSGQLIEFEPVHVEEQEDEDETSTDDPITSEGFYDPREIVSTSSPSSGNFPTEAQNDNHQELHDHPQTSNSNDNEVPRVACIPKLETSGIDEVQNSRDVELAINVQDDIIVLDDSDADIICLN